MTKMVWSQGGHHKRRLLYNDLIIDTNTEVITSMILKFQAINLFDFPSNDLAVIQMYNYIQDVIFTPSSNANRQMEITSLRQLALPKSHIFKQFFELH